jgi:hypothetical protein
MVVAPIERNVGVAAVWKGIALRGLRAAQQPESLPPHTMMLVIAKIEIDCGRLWRRAWHSSPLNVSKDQQGPSANGREASTDLYHDSRTLRERISRHQA